MIVTKISPQKKRTDRYNIEIDGEYAFSLSGTDLLNSRLARGDSINKQGFNDLLELSVRNKLKDYSIGYLASRPHSVFETKQYLHKKVYPLKNAQKFNRAEKDQIIESILEELVQKKYLDDVSFTDWFVKQRVNAKNPKGKAYIKHELMRKGISWEIIDSSLLQVTDDTENKAATLIAERKYKLLIKQETDLKKIREKLVKYLYSKGYTWTTIKTSVDSITHEF